MITNLDEAIAHAREVAEEQRKKAERNIIETTKEGWIRVYDGKEYNACLECAREHEQLADWLTELQERREADKWIPVSERLPDDRKKVRVTAYWHERFQVMDASYYGDGVWWCVPFNNCGKHMRNDLHVIAWKPDDEPYESEDN